MVVVNKDRNSIRCQYFWRCVAGLHSVILYEIIVILGCEYVSVRNHIKYFFPESRRGPKLLFLEISY